ncbi:MAG: Asp-tRNA(Asn)/Glu-tRNA(Gln) amidotransferase GatCAB subunit B, partial [Planctomycetes bacterium]|nr:Asp-tRNA(Asn)/Glu-tRNA(Gln) amidotransferase GatCAB subunit B [Planctomycetota bacterium]
DYRYFPEPDLVPVVVDEGWIERVRQSIGELPADRRDRLKAEYSLSDYDAGVIIDQGEAFADYFEELAKISGSSKLASNWLQQDVLRTLNERKITIHQFPVPAAELGSLIVKVQSGMINTHSAREVFAEMMTTGQPAEQIIRAKSLEQISDEDAIRKVVVAVLDANPQVLADFKKGKKREQVEGYARGLVMKEMRGKANSSLVQNLVAEELARRAAIPSA